MGTHRSIHHGGGINGFISELAYYPDDSLTVVVLANTSPAPSAAIANAIARTAFGMPPVGAPTPPADLPIPAEELTRLAGSYAIIWPDGNRRPTKIYANGEQLMFQVENQPALRMLKQSTPNTFAVTNQPGRVRFDIVNGAVVGFQLDRGARPLEAVRLK
jgi:hypothetical protein